VQQDDCTHIEVLYVTSIAGAKQTGMFSEGKAWSLLYGRTLGLPLASAQVIPAVGTNAFDMYTSMGQGTSNVPWNAWERARLGWIGGPILADASGTRFVETLEKPPTGQAKWWRLPNGVDVEVRNFTLGGAKPQLSLVLLHITNSLLDLDPFHLCRWYTLTVGQIYTLGDGLGIRTESIAADGSGATVTAFPYIGPITASCASGSK
jgi:hypothetical protein